MGLQPKAPMKLKAYLHYLAEKLSLLVKIYSQILSDSLLQNKVA